MRGTFRLNKARNETKHAHQECIYLKKIKRRKRNKMAKCLWKAYRWRFSCGQRSLKALWLEFRGKKKRAIVRTCQLVEETAVRLRDECFGVFFPPPKSSSCCAFARAASCFIPHIFFSPLPWRDGLFIIYFSLWYKNKTIFPLFFFLLGKIWLSGFPNSNARY